MSLQNNFATVRCQRILLERRDAWLVSINNDKRWIPRTLAALKDWRLAEFTVATWFIRRSLKPQNNNLRLDMEQVIAAMHLPARLAIQTNDNRPHQQEAFDKLMQLRSFALFMACRSGKTKVAIDLARNHYANNNIRQVLWLCPVTVIPTARMQWQVFGHDTLPADNIRYFGLESLSGCKYEKVSDLVAWIKQGPTMLIIDESHMVKNHGAVRSQRITRMADLCKVRGILSGSPITRNIRDLYQQFRMLDWRIFGYSNVYQFDRKHLEYSDKFPGLVERTKNVDYLTGRMHPFTYEHFPPDTDNDTHQTISVPMTTQQRELYDDIKYTVLSRIREYETDSIDVYLMFTGLQSVLSGFISERLLNRIYKANNRKALMLANNKPDALMRYRAGIDDKVVIWCSRRHELQTLRKLMPDAWAVDGSMSPDERHAHVQQFRQSKAGTLIAMTQVARRGIDMYEADVACFYGHSFDYEVRTQAAARIKAPGIKNRPCEYADFVCINSLDERMLANYDRKDSIIHEFLRKLKTDREAALAEMEQL